MHCKAFSRSCKTSKEKWNWSLSVKETEHSSRWRTYCLTSSLTITTKTTKSIFTGPKAGTRVSKTAKAAKVNLLKLKMCTHTEVDLIYTRKRQFSKWHVSAFFLGRKKNVFRHFCMCTAANRESELPTRVITLHAELHCHYY